MAVHERKISKFLGLYTTGRPSNSRLGLRSPYVEHNLVNHFKTQTIETGFFFLFNIVQVLVNHVLLQSEFIFINNQTCAVKLRTSKQGNNNNNNNKFYIAPFLKNQTALYNRYTLNIFRFTIVKMKRKNVCKGYYTENYQLKMR